MVAAANPSTGHYNRSRTIMDNIKISNAILSRFDLVFLMLDDPDLQRDKKLSEHVMRLHSRNRKRTFDQFNADQQMSQSYDPSASGQGSAVKHIRSQFGAEGDSFSQRTGAPSEIGFNTYQGYNNQLEKDMVQEHSTLGNRMKLEVERIPDKDVINPQLLKKYISYARHTIFPKLSMEACSVIKDFYISLRENAINS